MVVPPLLAGKVERHRRGVRLSRSIQGKRTDLTKDELRRQLRAARRKHVSALPEAMRALVFHRPPVPLLELVPQGASVGLYSAGPHEAPTQSYARFFAENGYTIALPRFSGRSAAMEFALHTDPFGQSDCEVGPFGMLQPKEDAETIVPDVMFVPLLGFTEAGARIGQGGGHYDRWLAGHPATRTIGLAWDVQKMDSLPLEPHDIALDCVVTPTRLYGPFA